MPGRATFADLPMGSTNAEKEQLPEAQCCVSSEDHEGSASGYSSGTVTVICSDSSLSTLFAPTAVMR